MSWIRKLFSTVREQTHGSYNLRGINESTVWGSMSSFTPLYLRMRAPSLKFSVTQATVCLKRTLNCGMIVTYVILIIM